MLRAQFVGARGRRTRFGSLFVVETDDQVVSGAGGRHVVEAHIFQRTHLIFVALHVVETGSVEVARSQRADANLGCL